MIEQALLPFQFAFMLKAFAIAAIIAVPAALLSCYVVLKGWSLMGDAISHAVLPGIVLSYLAGIPLIAGAFASGMACALASGYLSANSRVKPDTIMGVVFSGMFGLGLVMYVWVDTEVHLDHILFGNMLGVGADDLWLAGIVSAAITAAIALKWRDLLLHAFDPVQARASGLPTALFHYGLLAALSLTVVATLKAVGIILAIGLLIAPGAIAFLLTKRFGLMLVLAVGLTLGATVLGVWLSFHLDSAPAPTIILVLTGIFIAAFVTAGIRARRASAPGLDQDRAADLDAEAA